MFVQIDVFDEVFFGEVVVIDVQLVGFLLWVFGVIIDMFFGYVVFVLWIFLCIWLFDVGVFDVVIDCVVVVFVFVVSFVVFFFMMEVVLKGCSFGKFVVGGWIVCVDGGVVGFCYVFICVLLGVFEIYMIFGGIVVFIGVFIVWFQCLGDLVVGIYSQCVCILVFIIYVFVLLLVLVGWVQVVDVVWFFDCLVCCILQFLQSVLWMVLVVWVCVVVELLVEVVLFVLLMLFVFFEYVFVGIMVFCRECECCVLQNVDCRVEWFIG